MPRERGCKRSVARHISIKRSSSGRRVRGFGGLATAFALGIVKPSVNPIASQYRTNEPMTRKEAAAIELDRLAIATTRCMSTCRLNSVSGR